MYFKEECVGVQCDNCRTVYEQKHTGYCMFVDYENLHPEDDDWHVEDGKHFCPSCFTVDDNDKLHIKPIAPLYEVIADFPGNKDFPVGKIITFEPWNTYYWQHKVEDCQGPRTWLSEYFDQFPYLFKRVWE